MPSFYPEGDDNDRMIEDDPIGDFLYPSDTDSIREESETEDFAIKLETKPRATLNANLALQRSRPAGSPPKSLSTTTQLGSSASSQRTPLKMHSSSVPAPSASTSGRRYIQKIGPQRRSAAVANSTRARKSSNVSSEPSTSSGFKSSSTRRASTKLLEEHYSAYLDSLPRFELNYEARKRAYSGVFSRFTVNNNAISIHVTDGSDRRRPAGRGLVRRQNFDGTVRISEYEPLESDDHSYQYWCNEIGELIAGAVFGKAQEGAGWRLARFPESYQLYRKKVPKRVKKPREHEDDDGDEMREDIYLYGSPSKFSSPAEFVLHAIWLMHGAEANGCYCKYCYRKPDGQCNLQEPITGALEAAKKAAVP